MNVFVSRNTQIKYSFFPFQTFACEENIIVTKKFCEKFCRSSVRSYYKIGGGLLLFDFTKLSKTLLRQQGSNIRT